MHRQAAPLDLSDHLLERLREDADSGLYRARDRVTGGTMLLVLPSPRQFMSQVLERFERESRLASGLDPAWAIQPIGLGSVNGRPALILHDPGGLPLEAMLGRPMALKPFLSIAVSVAAALRGLHRAGLIHKDIRPANIFIDEAGVARLCGFGFTSRLARERQADITPEIIPGTLAYIAPEQSGRVNRSIDHRSDLYSLGVTLYQMLVGALPFTALQPMEWVYAHVARVPPPPSVRVEDVPDVVERIVLKLISKNAEDRYQTAAGLEHDLRQCLTAVTAGQPPPALILGKRDAPGRVLLPERLYGRQEQLRALVDAFKEISARGSFDLVLIAGEPGVGKSSIAGELRTTVYAADGLFAAGKFDQYKRDIPYATLATAFQDLIRQVLRLPEADLALWKERILAGLGPNGQAMIELFPNLELVIGKQKPLPEVSPQEAKNRFDVVFLSFVTAFASADHPLVLFLDDLQWLDTATLALLELLAGDEQVPYLLLVGAYRASEVGPGHALAHGLARIDAARGGSQLLALGPLRLSDMTEMVADALHTEADHAAPLAQIVFEKTQGNPFFATQFLLSLEADGLLTFDETETTWRWALERIRERAMTANVAGILAAKLDRYSGTALAVLRLLACFSKGATSETLRGLLPCVRSGVKAALRQFVDATLLHRVDRRYCFVHDGVRDAAYALVPERERAAMHLRIGRVLREALSRGETDNDIFEVVGHFNLGIECVDSVEERRTIAQLNLNAGERAKAAAAYVSATSYLEAGCALLTGDSWATDYQLTFNLGLHQSDCLFMLDRIRDAEAKLTALADRAGSAADLALVVGRQAGLYTFLGRIDYAVELLVGCLAQMGVVLPLHPCEEEVAAEYAQFTARMKSRSVHDLGALPAMTSPQWRDVMEPLVQLFSAAGIVNHDLHHLAVLRMANITIDHGLTDESAHGLACLAGLVLGWRYGTFEAAHDFGRLAMRLVDELGYSRYAPRIYAIISGTVGPWSRPLRDCYAIAVRASEIGREQGGITYSAYSWSCALTALLDSGKDLAEVDRQASHSLAVLAKMKFPLVVDFITSQLMMVRALRGMTDRLGTMDDADFDVADFEARLGSSPHLWHALVRHRIRQLQLQVLSGETSAALALAARLDGDVTALQVFEVAEFHFYAALARAGALVDGCCDPDRERRLVESSHAKLREWERLCPENFADRASLIAAEIARIDGRELEAERLYEVAIQRSREQGFLQNEALANEFAARFHAGRGLWTVANAYLAEALSRYRLWGAAAKVRQLERLHPSLAAPAEPTGQLGGTGMQLRGLDIAAAVDMHQALSREILLDQLIERLMVTVVEHAGAVRGLLLLSREGRLRIVAEAAISHDEVAVSLRPPAHFSGELPQSVLDYVERTHEAIIIDDAMAPNTHSIDPYILRARPRSVLCLPLVKQAKLVGVLYLENNLASHIFTQDRVAVLQFVASQAAISIENAELFRDVQRTRDILRQAGEELRRSFDMISALAWSASPDGMLEFSNKQWHDYTGITAEDARGATWMRAFHPDDLEKVSAKWRVLSEFSTSGEFEARMRRFDGQFRSFLVRLIPMRDDRGEVVKWHGTNTDIDDLKKAEEAQEALARASRVTAMGELTVSIAHEVNQPLMAIVTNAATCLRWLENNNPNVEEARLAAERIIRDGHRAGDVIASIRALAKKSPVMRIEVSLDEVVLEVVRLTRSEIDRHGIEVRTEFDPSCAHVLADRVQLQQVILNLVMNGLEAIGATTANQRVLEIATMPGVTGFVEVMVADTGCGLPADAGDDIFDAFFTTKPDGVGIGLSICQNIVESHGGRLWAMRGSTVGSVFRFSVPAGPTGGGRGK